ncbi:unnamed protein product, partial [Amoebophrya sp. A120]|eukprot:GSA120T00011296001.1
MTSIPHPPEARRVRYFSLAIEDKAKAPNPAERTRTFQRHSFVLVLRPDSDLADFEGQVIVTSTNRQLQGARLRNWWGFAGRKSADVALHDRCGGEMLADAARRALKRRREEEQLRGIAFISQDFDETAELRVGEVLPTPVPRRAGTSLTSATLRCSFVLHCLLPLYRPDVEKQEQQDVDENSKPAGDDDERNDVIVETRDISHVYASREIVSTTAEVSDAIATVVKKSLDWSLNATSLALVQIACPALGCGAKCYPATVAAEAFFTTVSNHQQLRRCCDPNSANGKQKVVLLEVRFWDTAVFFAWEKVAMAVLDEITEAQYWELRELGQTLERKRKTGNGSSCTIA